MTARNLARDSRPFIGWDGEGVTLPDGSHVFTLLMNSTGRYLWNATGLSTYSCFSFILKEALRIGKGVNHVWFAFGYDVNMMLGDLTLEELTSIHGEDEKEWHWCASANTAVGYRPHKTFSLRRRVVVPSMGGTINARVKMDDTFSFFGTTFLASCDEYLGKNWADRDLVIEGKSKRATSFEGYDKKDVIRYCHAELRALVRLMETLRERLAFVGIHPRDWFGPGAIASKVLATNRVKRHIGNFDDIVRGSLDLALRHSFIAGRFEVFRYGTTKEPTWRYDRRSAYPYALAQLASYTGEWEHVTFPSALPQEWVGPDQPLPLGLYLVTWRCPFDKAQYIQPFGYRRQDGHVLFPPKVTTWAWSHEIDQAKRLPYGKLTISEAWLFHTATPEKPFGFMEEMYNERAALKEQGHPAQWALKLGLNSIYGKLVQQVGWKRHEDGSTGTPPSYFCMFWASQITAITRAGLLKLVIDNNGYEDLIAFETDAAFTKRRWDKVPVGKALGEWEEAELHNLVYVQSGVYGCDEIPHVRGMTKVAWPTLERDGMTPQDMMRGLIRDRFAPYEYELTAFIGLGDGLRDMTRWRRWVTIHRQLCTLEPEMGLVKRNHDFLRCECEQLPERQENLWHRTTVWPKTYKGQVQRAYEYEWIGKEREVFDESEVELGW